MIELLKTRFESNRIHRGELSWAVVLARLEAHPEALDALRWMEESGGEPDVIGTDGEPVCGLRKGIARGPQKPLL